VSRSVDTKKKELLRRLGERHTAREIEGLLELGQRLVCQLNEDFNLWYSQMIRVMCEPQDKGSNGAAVKMVLGILDRILPAKRETGFIGGGAGGPGAGVTNVQINIGGAGLQRGTAEAHDSAREVFIGDGTPDAAELAQPVKREDYRLSIPPERRPVPQLDAPSESPVRPGWVGKNSLSNLRVRAAVPRSDSPDQGPRS
jgi:hypothetical protein